MKRINWWPWLLSSCRPHGPTSTPRPVSSFAPASDACARNAPSLVRRLQPPYVQQFSSSVSPYRLPPETSFRSSDSPSITTKHSNALCLKERAMQVYRVVGESVNEEVSWRTFRV